MPSAGSSEALRDAPESRGSPSLVEWDGARMAGSSMPIRAEMEGPETPLPTLSQVNIDRGIPRLDTTISML